MTPACISLSTITIPPPPLSPASPFPGNEANSFRGGFLFIVLDFFTSNCKYFVGFLGLEVEVFPYSLPLFRELRAMESIQK